MPVQLGIVADDFTGATDVANEINGLGLRTLLLLGPEAPPLDAASLDAAVIALKIRTVPADRAVKETLRALDALRALGTSFFYYKYCSTFDSTDRGNIGPVAECLMDALGETASVTTPAFPRTGRTVYKGHLFVNGRLLGDTHMRHHPLTPMTDSNLVDLMARQSEYPVDSIDHAEVRQGAEAIRKAFRRRGEKRHSVLDVLYGEDLAEAGRAALGELRFASGASGLAWGLAKAMVETRGAGGGRAPAGLPQVGGGMAALAGSCSAATLAQIAAFSERHPVYRVDAMKLAEGVNVAAEAVEWARGRADREPVLIHTSVPTDRLREIQNALGADRASGLAERAMAEAARGLIDSGVRRLIVAGGETAGAVLGALGVHALNMGPEIDPGVPWTWTATGPPLLLALKSGNFGSDDFFTKAFAMTL